jgi:hypothetical protein
VSEETAELVVLAGLHKAIVRVTAQHLVPAVMVGMARKVELAKPVQAVHLTLYTQ